MGTFRSLSSIPLSFRIFAVAVLSLALLLPGSASQAGSPRDPGAPKQAATTIDDADPAITYTGAWTHKARVKKAYAATLSTSATVGNSLSVTLPVDCDRLTLVYATSKRGGQLEVRLGSNVLITLDQHVRRGASYQRQWSITNLLTLYPGENILTLTHISGRSVTFDGLITRDAVDPMSSYSIDDAALDNIAYDGYWQPLTRLKGASLATSMSSLAAGDKATLQFHGKQIALFYASEKGAGQIEVQIDSGSPAAIDQYQRGKATYVRRWQSEVLADTDHTLVITHLGGGKVNVDAFALPRIDSPSSGDLYHGVYPGGVTGEEDDLTPADLEAYEAAAGKDAAWVYFSNNWYRSRLFPLETATWVRAHGSVPYVRLMLRSSPDQGRKEKRFTLSRINKGTFDRNLRAWAQAARDFGTPIIAEYGTEVNGGWFPWNGRWNGRNRGPAAFRNAYRRIVAIFRQEGAFNVTWVFHPNDGDWPQNSWNRLENYFPGEEWVDWIGVSIYGAQTPQDDYCDPFTDTMDAVYPRLAALSPSMPVFVAEFGVTDGNSLCNQAAWAEDALTSIVTNRWSRVTGLSWWNEWWQNDDDPAHDTDMRVQTNPDLEAVFQTLVGSRANVLDALTLP